MQFESISSDCSVLAT